MEFPNFEYTPEELDELGDPELRKLAKSYSLDIRDLDREDIIERILYYQDNILSNDEYTLIHIGESGNLKALKYLVSRGRDLKFDTDNSNNVLRAAVRAGNLNIVKYLGSLGPSRYDIHADNDVELIIAAGSGHLDIVKYLIEHGADIHAQNDAALDAAEINGRDNVIRYLLSVGDYPDEIIEEFQKYRPTA